MTLPTTSLNHIACGDIPHTIVARGITPCLLDVVPLNVEELALEGVVQKAVDPLAEDAVLGEVGVPRQREVNFGWWILVN